MRQIEKSITFILLMSLMVSCKDNFITPNPEPVNLIDNPSFETNGQPSLQSWWISYTVLSNIIQDAPPAGGKFSLELSPGWVPQVCFARAFVSGQSGTGMFKLTACMKNNSHGLLWRAYVSLGHMASNQWVRYKSISSDSTNWTTVSIIDTMLLQASDTLAVQLSGGAAELGFGHTLFDVVSLQRIQ